MYTNTDVLGEGMTAERNRSRLQKSYFQNSLDTDLCHDHLKVLVNSEISYLIFAYFLLSCVINKALT